MNVFDLFESPQLGAPSNGIGAQSSADQHSASPIGSGTSKREAKKKPVTMMGVAVKEDIDEGWFDTAKKAATWFIKKDGQILRSALGEPFTFKDKEAAIAWAKKNYKVSFDQQRIYPTTNPDKNLIREPQVAEAGKTIKTNFKMPPESLQDKMYRQHQELRKQRGLPDPEEYKRRIAQKQAEIDALKEGVLDRAAPKLPKPRNPADQVLRGKVNAAGKHLDKKRRQELAPKHKNKDPLAEGEVLQFPKSPEDKNVRARLEQRLLAAFNQIVDYAEDNGIDILEKNAPLYSKLFDKYDTEDANLDPEQAIARNEPIEVVAQVVKEVEHIAKHIDEYLENMWGDTFNESGVDEGWKSALAGAALAGSMALGGGIAHAGEPVVGVGQSQDMQMAVDLAKHNAKLKYLKSVHGDNFQDKQMPEYHFGKLDLKANGKGGYMASVPLIVDSEVQEALEEDIERHLLLMRRAGYDIVQEEWSDKYKRSINCSNPKGFSQKAHCVGRKKNEDVAEARDGDTNFGSTVTQGSWVVYGDGKVKRFKTRDGAKAYAEKMGGKVASSEFYADNIQGKQGVAEGSLNEFAPDGFNSGDDDEGFSPEIAKMAQEDGFTKGASLADGATLERAMTINHWHSQHGGIYKQYFAKGFKAGRMNKIRHDNKQYNLNLKLMKDGSIRHGEQQGVAEEKVRLDPKCWSGKKIGNPKTKMKGGVRVNNCVPK